MSRLTPENTALARQLVLRYPRPRSALIPLLHVAQAQDGHLTEDAMEHIAELLDLTPAEVIGTASFYEMFKQERVGTYVVNVCTNISCMLVGGEELLHHLEHRLGIKPGSTTPDGMFTLEEVECIAACTEAPCLQVNYRYFGPVSHDDADELLENLRAGKLTHEVPRHGVLCRIRQRFPDDFAGGVPPDRGAEPPWMAQSDEGAES